MTQKPLHHTAFPVMCYRESSFHRPVDPALYSRAPSLVTLFHVQHPENQGVDLDLPGKGSGEATLSSSLAER